MTACLIHVMHLWFYDDFQYPHTITMYVFFKIILAYDDFMFLYICIDAIKMLQNEAPKS